MSAGQIMFSLFCIQCPQVIYSKTDPVLGLHSGLIRQNIATTFVDVESHEAMVINDPII